MNIEQLRHSLKVKWLTYYRSNRHWLAKLGVWITYEGQRRPSSSFILGTLTTLEPQLTQMLPLVVDLTNHPDRIVQALGLNFNPEEELKALEVRKVASMAAEAVKMLPGGDRPVELSPDRQAGPKVMVPLNARDADCVGNTERLPPGANREARV